MDIKEYLEKNIFPIKDKVIALNEEKLKAERELKESDVYKNFQKVSGRLRVYNTKLQRGYEGLVRFRR
jgi:hypothetical protein